MTIDIEIRARNLWEEKKFIQSVEVGLEQLSIEEIRSSQEFTSLFLNLAYSLYSASEIKLYDEYCKIFQRYMTIVNNNIDLEPPIGYHNNACLMQHNLMAVIFQYYQKKRNLDDIQEAIDLVKFWSVKVPDINKLQTFNFNLLKLSHLIFDKKYPYYIVSFQLPLALPLPDGEYQVSIIGNIKSINIENKQYKDITSIIRDRHFSSVKITIEGFTSTDNFWNGPSIGCTDGAFNINICLQLLNQIIFQSKLIREDLRLKTITYQDIGRSTTTQFNGSGEVFHSTVSFGFGGDALTDTLSRQELENKDIEKLTKKLNSSKLNLHEELFAEALIEESNENLTSAFYLLNSSCESLIQEYIYLVARKHNREHDYELFMQGKSFCLTCDLYNLKKENIEPPRNSMPPSLFTQLKFLKDINVSTNTQLKEMQKLLLKVRNDDLRNSLIHGRTNYIPRNSVIDAINGYRGLKIILENMLNNA